MVAGDLGMGTEKTWHGSPNLRVTGQCNIVVGGVGGINEEAPGALEDKEQKKDSNGASSAAKKQKQDSDGTSSVVEVKKDLDIDHQIMQ